MEFFKKYKVDIISILLIVALTFIFSAWLFNENNFFVFDDYYNLVRLPYVEFSDIMVIFPTDAYCSRPVGWIIVKIILGVFGLNYLGHVCVMLTIHAINAVLVYLIFKKIFEKLNKKEVFALITALVFALYPVTTMPSYWEAAMFDLFGCTLMLITILLFLKINVMNKNENKYLLKKVIYSTIMILTYYISLRSKEMFLAIPGFLFMYSIFTSFFENKQEKFKDYFKNFDLKSFLKKNIYLFIMIIVMIAYFIAFRQLSKTNQYTNNEVDAYFYTFEIGTLFKNMYYYLRIYFNPNSLVYADVPTTIRVTGWFIIYLVIVCSTLVINAVMKFLKGQYINMALLIGYIVAIAPVLPMPNLHTVWYLYAPSVFMGGLIIITVYDILYKFVKKEKCSYILVVIALISLLGCNCITRVKEFRNWWLDFANNYKKTYNYLLDFKEVNPDCDEIYVINVPEGYTTFYNGDGHIVRVAYDNPDLEVHINEELPDEPNIVYVDYYDIFEEAVEEK